MLQLTSAAIVTVAIVIGILFIAGTPSLRSLRNRRHGGSARFLTMSTPTGAPGCSLSPSLRDP
jgi:hypothetical protein